jgi:hypothetical protein
MGFIKAVASATNKARQTKVVTHKSAKTHLMADSRIRWVLAKIASLMFLTKLPSDSFVLSSLVTRL